MPSICRCAPESGRPSSWRKIFPVTTPYWIDPAESRGAGGLGVHRSGWSGRYASIGRLARGPAPGLVPSRGRPKIRLASDSIVTATFSAGTGVPLLVSAAPVGSPPAGSSLVGSSPLLRAASGGALASGSGVCCSFLGGAVARGGVGGAA